MSGNMIAKPSLIRLTPGFSSLDMMTTLAKNVELLIPCLKFTLLIEVTNSSTDVHSYSDHSYSDILAM